MIGWTVFYRMLGLPEEMTDPNYYELLGIRPEECNAPRVQQALEERRQLLRSNIPGGHFVPLVMKFEAEELAQAVSVLGDDQKRQIYDDYLKRESHKDLAANVKKHRQLVVQAAKTLVSDAMNKDGTLGPEKRAALADRLGYLGFTEGGVKVVLDGIPMAVEKSESLADQAVEDFVGVVLGLVEDEGYDDPDQEEGQEEEEPEDAGTKSGSGRIWKVVLLWIFSLVIPFAAILFFTFFLMYTNEKLAERQDRQKPGGDAAVSVPKNQTDDHQESPKEIQKPREPEENQTSTENTPGPVVSEEVTEILKEWSDSALPNDRLADVAMTLLGCCDRVDRFATNYSNVYGMELRQLLASKSFSDRKYALIRHGRQDRMYDSTDRHLTASSRARIGLLLNESCKRLEAQLAQADKARQYQAIETLRIYDTQQASQILLDVLYDRKDIEPQVVGRILRALSQMSDPAIPAALAMLLQKPRRILVRPIVDTLAKINDITDLSPEICPGILPFSFTSRDLKSAANWWDNHYRHGGTYRRRGFSVNAPVRVKEPVMGDTELEVLDLIKTIDHYGGIMADTLSAYSRKDQWSEGPDDRKDYIPVDPDETSPFGTLGRIARQCSRLARTHPKRKTWAVRIDLVEMDQQRRLALCQTACQKAVVHMDTTGRLLAILIEQADPQGRYYKAVEKIQGQWRNVSNGNEVDVIEQMRLRAYHNLMLWDLLTQCMGQ